MYYLIKYQKNDAGKWEELNRFEYKSFSLMAKNYFLQIGKYQTVLVNTAVKITGIEVDNYKNKTTYYTFIIH